MSTGQESLRRLLDADPRAVSFLYFVAGSMFTLTFAPLSCYALAPVLVLPLLTACLWSAPRRAARYAFWFGAGLFLFGTYWLYTSIHVFGQASLWIAIPLMIALVLIMAAWYAVLGWLTAALSAGRPWRLVAVAPAAWVAVEWFRGWFLTGFPWLSLGYGQVDSPLAGWLPVVGVYGVSFLAVFSAAAFVPVATMDGRSRRIGIVLTLLPWLVGAGLQQIDWVHATGPARTATIVQGGISQDRKWLPEQRPLTLELYRQSLGAHSGSDLVVWPEVALPYTIDQVEPYLVALQSELEITGQTLLLGILERDGDAVYNSLLMLGSEARQVYRKRHLVPFGEFFPVPDFIREWMRLMSLPYSDMTAGAPEQALLTMPDGTSLASVICYEDAYGAEQLFAFPEAEIIINVSNDAWFGDSIAPHQHLQIARVRAREAGRFVVRATNNGISAFVGPRGEVLQTAPQFRYASLTMEIAPMGGATPYVVVGNWPVLTVAFLLLGWFARVRPPGGHTDPRPPL